MPSGKKSKSSSKSQNRSSTRKKNSAARKIQRTVRKRNYNKKINNLPDEIKELIAKHSQDEVKKNIKLLKIFKSKSQEYIELFEILNEEFGGSEENFIESIKRLENNIKLIDSYKIPKLNDFLFNFEKNTKKLTNILKKSNDLLEELSFYLLGICEEIDLPPAKTIKFDNAGIYCGY